MREGSYRVANPRRGGGYSVQQVSEIPMVVGGRTPLVEGDHNFGYHMFGYASRFGRRRQKREEVTQRHRELGVALLEPAQVRSQHFDRREFMSDDQCISGAAHFSNRLELA